MKKILSFLLFVFILFSIKTASAQNYGLTFTNQNLYAQIPSTPTLELTGALTLEAWIYPTAWRTNVYEGCILNKEGISYQGYMLRCGANGTLNFNIGTGTAWKELSSASGTLVLNTWQHIAGVYDGTVLKIYVNGVQVGSTTAYTGAVATNTAIPLEIGRSNYYPSRNYLGRIDEVRIFNSAVSGTDILAYYNSTLTSSHPNYATLVGYYEMDNFNTDTDTDGNLDFTATVGVSGEVFGAPYGPSCNALFTSSAPAGVTSIEAYQSTTAPASLGGTNQHIIKIAVDAFADVALSQLVFQTNGTTNLSDILNARVWYTGSNGNFSPTTQFGTTIAAPPTANTNMTFTGTQTIPCGRSYLWLTYDIAPSATLTNLVDAKFISATLDGATLLPLTSDPVGSREIAATCTHTLRITATTSGGWNGGLVDVNVNGTPVLTGIGSTFTSGLGPIDFTFNAGTADAISVVRTAAGTYPTRMRVQILDGNSTSVLAAIEPTTTGVNAIGYCGGIAYTTAATLVTAYSAQLNGSYANCIPTETGFRYKKTSETIWNFVQDSNNPMYYDLQGLIPATNYHYQAYAIVGVDTLWGTTISFATTCVPFTIPFAESFNSTTMPLCWTNSPTNSFNFATTGTSPTASPFFGSGMARFAGYSYSSGAVGYLVTPAIANLTTGMEVRFWFHRQDFNNTYTVGAIRVKANNTNNPTNAVLLTTVQRVYNQAPPVPAAGWYEYVAVIPADTFTHIIFECTSDYWGNIYLDEVSIDYPATCPRPPATSVTTPVVLNTSATINWLRGGAETEWEVSYKTTTETTWTTETAYDTIHTILNLIPATTYQVKVRAVCAPGDASLWTLEKTFTTLCDPIATLPLVEDCENTNLDQIPICYNKLISGTANVKVVSSDGSKMINFDAGSTTNNCFLILPLTVDPVNTLRIMFKYYGGANHLFKIGYMTDPSNAASFVELHNAPLSTAGTWKSFDLITPNTMVGNERIAIRFVMASGYSARIDSLTIMTQPPCVEPTTLVLTNSGIGDATVSWAGTGTSYNLEYKEVSGTTWTTFNNVTSPYNIINLTQNTAYEFRVQTICDGGVLSGWSPSATFNTLCDLINVLPYVQDFETTAVNDIPTCYNKIQSGGGTVKVIDLTAEYPTAGKVLQMDFGSSSSGDAYIVLPKFNFPVNTLRIGFKFYGGNANHRIGYITDPANAATFVEIINQTIVGGTGEWRYFDLLTNNTLTGNERIAIRYSPAATWHNNRYDSLSVMTMPSCLPPFGLTATNVGAYDATLNWTQATVGTAVDYNIEYKKSTETTWTLISNVTPTYNLTSLLPMTTYQFRVQANCSATEISDFSMPVSFTTLCAPLTPPTVSEPFAAMLPNACWERKSGALPATGNATLTNITSGWLIRTSLGQNTAAVNQYSTSCQYWLITPSIDLGDGSVQYQMDFDIAITDYYNANVGNTAQSPNARFVVLISTDNGTTWNSTGIIKQWSNSVGTPFSTLSNTLQSQTIPLYDSVAMAPYSGIVKFAFFAYENDASYTYDNDIHIDNFQVNPYNSCSRPIAVSATNVGSYSAQINWTETGTATSWVIEYGAPGFTLGTGTTVNASTNPYVISGLSPLTAYQYYVKSDCGAGNTSNWSLPGTFTTLPSCPVPTAFTASNVTTTSVTLSWTEMGTATSWEIEYGTANFVQGTGTIVTASATPHLISTLNNSTAYDFYIRSVCGVGDNSVWSTKITITTPCLPMSLPLIEGFESGTTIPICWTTTTTAANYTVVTSGSSPTATPHGGTRMLHYNSYGISSGNHAVLFSPLLNVTGAAIQVSYWQYRDPGYATYLLEGVEVFYNTTPSMTGATSLGFTSRYFATAGWYNITYTIPAGITGDLYVMFKTNSLYGNNQFIDDINVNYFTPACATPTNLAISAITQTQATATWTAGGTETSWEVAYKASAASTWMTAIVNTTPSYIIPSLTAGTAYDVKVRAICGPADTSAYTAIVNFTTSSIPTCNAPTGLAVTNNGIGSVSINWIPGGSETSWEVDYKLASATTWTTILAPTHPYFLMALNTCSDYNVRVRAVCSAGLYSNYTAVVNFTTTTPPPTNVQVTNITDQSALATWTAGGTETSWQVEYKLVSSANWTTATVSVPQHPLTGLQSNSLYEVRVKALCTPYESIFTTPVQFTTIGLTFTITATAGSNGTITPSGAVTVNQGANQTFTFSPNTGYVVSVVTVDGTPITGTPASYTFTNILANHTINVDFGVGIEENELAQLVELFPNPTTAIIELRLKADDLHIKECKIYDMYGKLMRVIQIDTETTSIDVTDFASGVYFVRMDSERGTISKKFVKK